MSDGKLNNSSLQNVPPPPNKKVLDILFGQEERNPSALTGVVDSIPEVLIHLSGGRPTLYDTHI